MSYQCELCGFDSFVVDSRHTYLRGRPAIRRRRQCIACDHRWRTNEIYVGDTGRMLEVDLLKLELTEIMRKCQDIITVIEREQDGKTSGSIEIRTDTFAL